MSKKAETSSFVLRFTQKIFKNEANEDEVQWRGNIRHVQDGEEKRFSEMEEAWQFMQSKLTDMTISATEDKSSEEQKSILAKSFDLWKKMAQDAPKMVLETIKDPKKQVEKVQAQITQVGAELTHRIGETIEQRKEDLEEWRGVSKADYKEMMEVLATLAKDVKALNKKVNALSKKGE